MPNLGPASEISEETLLQIRQRLASAPEIEETAELLKVAGNSTRFKLLNLLDGLGELSVADLAEMLGTSVASVSQGLAKLKAYGMVKPRRESQTTYYSLTDHDFNQTLRENLFVELGF